MIARLVDIKFEYGHKQISGDRTIVEALRKHTNHGDINPYLACGRQISAGMRLANSIDSFLDSHKDDHGIRLCGKLAIAKCILDAEKNSTLYIDPFADPEDRLNFDRVADTWFVRFFKILHDGIAKSDLDSLFDRVSIINFNYDRCVEYFLVHAIQAFFSVEENRAQAVVSHLRIFHPYGTVGPLPWQDPQKAVPFGSSAQQADVLLALSQSLRTYTEQLEEGDVLAAIRNEVRRADAIVFLGFGFHRQNMDLITPPRRQGQKTSQTRVYGTAKNVSKADCQVIENQVRAVLRSANKEGAFEIRNDLGCAGLFDDYWRSFTLR